MTASMRSPIGADKVMDAGFRSAGLLRRSSAFVSNRQCLYERVRRDRPHFPRCALDQVKSESKLPEKCFLSRTS